MWGRKGKGRDGVKVGAGAEERLLEGALIGHKPRTPNKSTRGGVQSQTVRHPNAAHIRGRYNPLTCPPPPHLFFIAPPPRQPPGKGAGGGARQHKEATRRDMGLKRTPQVRPSPAHRRFDGVYDGGCVQSVRPCNRTIKLFRPGVRQGRKP